MPRSTLVMVGAALALTLTACGGDPTETDASDSESIIVGAADFGESQIIAEIYAQALEADGVTVDRRIPAGQREAYLQALESGQINLVPEYSGNLLTYYQPDATATAPDDVAAALGDALPDGFEVLEISPAEDKDSLNVTRELAESEGLETIADLAKLEPLRLAANPEFEQRSYGIPGLEEVYGITGVEFTPISDSGGPATVRALIDGDVDVADIYSTTPSIAANDLVTLEDPENMIAAQNIVPLISSDKASDAIVDVLDAVSAALTTEDLIALNERYGGDEKASPATIAADWLEENDLG